MEPQNPLRMHHQELPAFPVPGHRFGAGSDASRETNEAGVRPAAQAERSVMHPDPHDLEWRYCRGGWAG
jgi:hypothetical protein